MRIVDYDPAWPGHAETLLRVVRTAVNSLDRSNGFVYEHIGSTAVPGLAAKPLVDLQVCMPVLAGRDDLTGLLAPVGFIPAFGARTDSPGVFRDTPRPGYEGDVQLLDKRLFHAPEHAAILHIRRTDSPFAAFVVLFRD